MHLYQIKVPDYEGTQTVTLCHDDYYSPEEFELAIFEAVKEYINSITKERAEKYRIMFILCYCLDDIIDVMKKYGFKEPEYTSKIDLDGNSDVRSNCRYHGEQDCTNNRLAKYLKDNGIEYSEAED
jgi:hypothetical protein